MSLSTPSQVYGWPAPIQGSKCIASPHSYHTLGPQQIKPCFLIWHWKSLNDTDNKALLVPKLKKIYKHKIMQIPQEFSISSKYPEFKVLWDRQGHEIIYDLSFQFLICWHCLISDLVIFWHNHLDKSLKVDCPQLFQTCGWWMMLERNITSLCDLK